VAGPNGQAGGRVVALRHLVGGGRWAMRQGGVFQQEVLEAPVQTQMQRRCAAGLQQVQGLHVRIALQCCPRTFHFYGKEPPETMYPHGPQMLRPGAYEANMATRVNTGVKRGVFVQKDPPCCTKKPPWFRREIRIDVLAEQCSTCRKGAVALHCRCSMPVLRRGVQRVQSVRTVLSVKSGIGVMPSGAPAAWACMHW